MLLEEEEKRLKENKQKEKGKKRKIMNNINELILFIMDNDVLQFCRTVRYNESNYD